MTPFTEAEEIRTSQEMKQMAGKTQQVDPNEAATVIQKCNKQLKIIFKMYLVFTMFVSAYRGYKVRVKYGDELMERFQENSTLQRKYGRPQYPQDATQEVLSSPSAATLDEKTKNSIRRRRQEMVAFAAQVQAGNYVGCFVCGSLSQFITLLNHPPWWRSAVNICS